MTCSINVPLLLSDGRSWADHPRRAQGRDNTCAHATNSSRHLRVSALTRQQAVLLGGFVKALGFASVPTGQTHGCRPVATAFLSTHVGKQHLRNVITQKQARQASAAAGVQQLYM
jgi:hypothetical protein